MNFFLYFLIDSRIVKTPSIFDFKKGLASAILLSTKDSAAKLITASHLDTKLSTIIESLMLPLTNS